MPTLPVATALALPLAEGEVVVRRFHVTTSRWFYVFGNRGRGDLVVTTRRLLFLSQSFAPHRVYKAEIPLTQVTGCDFYVGRQLSIWRLLAGVILLIFAFAPRIIDAVVRHSASPHAGFGGHLVAFLAFLLGAYLFITFFLQRLFIFTLFGQGVVPSPIFVASPGAMARLVGWLSGGGPASGNAATRTIMLAGARDPGPDAMTVVNILSAMILDLQTSGALAVERWQSSVAPQVL